MQNNETWRNLFKNWPANMDRRGVIIATFGEQIPFNDFLTSESILALDRTTPDTMGARKVLIPYESIAGVKFIDVIQRSTIVGMGFEEGQHRRSGDLLKKL